MTQHTSYCHRGALQAATLAALADGPKTRPALACELNVSVDSVIQVCKRLAASGHVKMEGTDAAEVKCKGGGTMWLDVPLVHLTGLPLYDGRRAPEKRKVEVHKNFSPAATSLGLVEQAIAKAPRWVFDLGGGKP